MIFLNITDNPEKNICFSFIFCSTNSSVSGEKKRLKCFCNIFDKTRAILIKFGIQFPEQICFKINLFNYGLTVASNFVRFESSYYSV